MSAETHLRALEASRREHLSEIRELRQKIWHDSELDLLDRTVLGLTGSASQLKQKRALEKAVGSVVEQPMMIIKRVGTNGRVSSAEGGIITAPLRIGSSRLGCIATGYAVGHADLIVPVARPVTSNDGEISVAAEPAGLLVARITYDESGNTTLNPDKDYTDEIFPSAILLGRRAIFNDDHFMEEERLGILLQAIEKTYTPPSQTTSS